MKPEFYIEIPTKHLQMFIRHRKCPKTQNIDWIADLRGKRWDPLTPWDAGRDKNQIEVCFGCRKPIPKYIQFQYKLLTSK